MPVYLASVEEAEKAKKVERDGKRWKNGPLGPCLDIG